MSGVEVTARSAKHGLEVQFRVSPGEVLALVGPNGAGKSTAAAVIAGTVDADEAVVRVGDRVVTDTARSRQVPPHRRRVGLLAQDPMLFPHLSALGNVEFAARRGARSRSATRRAALRWLDLVGAADLATRRPRELSGGQAQRVAIARALAAEPEVLVLDEPSSGLDVASAAAVRAVLGRVMTDGGRAAVLITHDLLDVLALADRVLVLEGGRIAESGSVPTFLAAPRSSFGARFAGVNLVGGIAATTGTLRATDGGTWHGLPAEPLSGGQEAVAVFSPAAVSVFRQRPVGSPRNSVQRRVAGWEWNGTVVRVRGEDHPDGTPGLAADITPDAAAELRLVVGDAVWFTVKAQEVRMHAAQVRRRPYCDEPAGRHD